ncbi:uncharacterized protein ACIB01_015640 [Guaruba guarouba]
MKHKSGRRKVQGPAALPEEKAEPSSEPPPCKRQRDAPGEEVCGFCHRADCNPEVLGQLCHQDGLCVHENCLYHASGLNQRGTDKEGFYGFLFPDIQKELKRVAQKRCCICRRPGASVTCRARRCPRTFHYPCGSERGCVSQFFGEFKSFCWKHQPVQRVQAVQQDQTLCLICQEAVAKRPCYDTLVCPTCTSAWFHRRCIQGQALSSALYHFCCPLCQDMVTFQAEMFRLGIKIPDRLVPSPCLLPLCDAPVDPLLPPHIPRAERSYGPTGMLPGRKMEPLPIIISGTTPVTPASACAPWDGRSRRRMGPGECCSVTPVAPAGPISAAPTWEKRWIPGNAVTAATRALSPPCSQLRSWTHRHRDPCTVSQLLTPLLGTKRPGSLQDTSTPHRPLSPRDVQVLSNKTWIITDLGLLVVPEHCMARATEVAPTSSWHHRGCQAASQIGAGTGHPVEMLVSPHGWHQS